MSAEPAMRADTCSDPSASLAWLTAHLPEFTAAPAGARAVAKRCTELAFAHAHLRTWIDDDALPAEPFDAHLDAWRDTLRRHCERSLPFDDLYMAQPYLWLRAGGERVAACERELARLARRGERPASIGVLHCLWKAGVLRHEPDWRAAIARWLAAWDDDDRALDGNAYRVTHAVFYVTDLGTREPPAGAERLGAPAERLLRRSRRRERWDLVGELVIALQCLGRAAAARSEAARAFAAHVDAHRSDPFRSRYHVTMVDVLRCALARRRATSET